MYTIITLKLKLQKGVEGAKSRLGRLEGWHRAAGKVDKALGRPVATDTLNRFKSTNIDNARQELAGAQSRADRIKPLAEKVEQRVAGKAGGKIKDNWKNLKGRYQELTTGATGKTVDSFARRVGDRGGAGGFLFGGSKPSKASSVLGRGALGKLSRAAQVLGPILAAKGVYDLTEHTSDAEDFMRRLREGEFRKNVTEKK